MARPRGGLTRCGGRWTEARFNSFIKNQLRGATRKWAPISDCLKGARTKRGFYRCNGCKEEAPTTVLVSRKRSKNVFVDHIEPIVPTTGWVSWDHCVDSMFCEGTNLQLLCKACHDTKSAGEAAERKVHRDKNKTGKANG